MFFLEGGLEGMGGQVSLHCYMLHSTAMYHLRVCAQQVGKSDEDGPRRGQFLIARYPCVCYTIYL